MHEMAIAEQMAKVVLKTAAENNATSVDEIEMEIGEMRLIVPSALELAFEVVCQDTIAADAELKITEKLIKAKCETCDILHKAEIGNYTCPQCGKADGKIVQGDELTITSILCNVEEAENTCEN